MPGELQAAGAIAELLSKVFGFVVDPDGLAQLSRANLLKYLMRGINEGIACADWASVDALFFHYRELRQPTGP